MPLSGQPQNLHICGRALNSRHGAAKPAAVSVRESNSARPVLAFADGHRACLNSWCGVLPRVDTTVPSFSQPPPASPALMGERR